MIQIQCVFNIALLYLYLDLTIALLYYTVIVLLLVLYTVTWGSNFPKAFVYSPNASVILRLSFSIYGIPVYHEFHLPNFIKIVTQNPLH